jgi:hypothetical protein
MAVHFKVKPPRQRIRWEHICIGQKANMLRVQATLLFWIVVEGDEEFSYHENHIKK